MVPAVMRRFLLIGAACVALASGAAAQDWPQFLGPARTGVYTGPPLAETWGADGPRALWRKTIGAGFSGPVVVQGRVIQFHRLSNEEIVARCDHFLKLMGAWLAKREWLALGRPSIAVVSCFGPISMLKLSGYDTDRWPNVTRWLERIKALPGAHDIDGNPFAKG